MMPQTADKKGQGFFRLNLQRKWIALFLLIGIVPMLVVGVLNLLTTSEALRTRVIDDEKSRVALTASEIERFLDTTIADLNLLRESVVMQDLAQAITTSNSLQIQQARSQLEQEFLNFARQRQVEGTPVYEHIRFLDPDGFELVRIDLTADGMQAASGFGLNYRTNEEYFQQAQQLEPGGIHVSPIELFDEFGQIQEPYTPVLRYSTPVYVGETFVGVVVTDVRAQGFLEQVQNLAIGNVLAFMVGADGYYLTHPDASKLYGRDLGTDIRVASEQPALANLLGSTQPGVREDSEEIVVYHPVGVRVEGGPRWMLYTVSPLSTVLAPVNQQRNTLLLVLGLAMVLVVVIAVVVARNTSQPILELSRTATAVAGGDLDQRVEIERTDEIGQLATSFNSMTEQLSTLVSTLEERVSARTRDLQVAAEVSQQITTVLDINELLKQVVTLVARNFDLYGAFVFLYDDQRQVLDIASVADASGRIIDTGEVETISIDARPSIVAMAARTREPVTIDDVRLSEAYLSLGQFPETRSELAIPMIQGDRVLGVFDLQSQQVGRFGEDELRVLGTLAEQIAIAIRNAELYMQTEAARRTAEEANRVKTLFFANVSHELRTPLNAILNFTDLVATGAFGDVNTDQVEALEQAYQNGQHLLALINDILDMTKIEAGMMSLFIETFDPAKVVDEAIATGQGLLDETKPVTLAKEVADDLPSMTADQRRVRQILINLVSNAVKFTEEGTITVRAAAEDGHIRFAVADTGVGIDPQEQTYIFESFRQAEHGLREASGTGLGLAICRHLAEAHGGSLGVDSTPGEGSTFYVELPLVYKAEEAPTLAERPSIET